MLVGANRRSKVLVHRRNLTFSGCPMTCESNDVSDSSISTSDIKDGSLL